MSKNPQISILVPIYNVQDYLQQCLESLTNQTLRDLEIICINDGSTDKSLSIIKHFQKSDSRIKLINKSNSGYGDSMNRGLAKARGKYIGIVEPDDYIDLDAFEKLYSYADTFDAEVVRANYYFNRNGEDQKNYYVDVADTGRIVSPLRHPWILYQSPAIWSAIYRRDFLTQHDIKFLPTPGASYQDTGFNFKVWANDPRTYFTTEAFLHYRTDNESSSVNNPGKVMNVCYEYAEIEKYLREQGLFDELAPLLQATKFGAYYWNICRLRAKLLPDFLKQVKSEYTTAQQEGYITAEYFESKPQWKLLNHLLKHSVRNTICYLQVLRAKARLRNAAKALWLKTHPVYRKQQLMSELIADLTAENDILATKLKALEDKHHE